jgi:hypothetical protein
MSGCSSSGCALKFRDKRIGGTYRLQFAIKKNSAVWVGITSVTFTFTKPDRTTTFEGVGTESETPGTWYYDTTVDDLDTLGFWTVDALVVDGDISIPSDTVGFRVVA